jgi:hypothetical protein
MDFTSCDYNYAAYNFTTHQQESCLGLSGLWDSSELLIVNFCELWSCEFLVVNS